jgi:hypothetical protein
MCGGADAGSPAAVFGRCRSARRSRRHGPGPCVAGRRSSGCRVRRTGSRWVARRVGEAAPDGGPRRAIQASRAASVSASRGTMRSVSSLPSGTRSQLPWLGVSHRQSSSRSSSSPMRSPVPRSISRPHRTNRSSRVRTAPIRARSMSGGRARGRGRGSLPVSEGSSSRPGGRSAQPQIARWSKNMRRSTTVPCDTEATTGRSRATRPRQGRPWFHTRNPSM